MGLLDGLLGSSFDDPKTAAALQFAGLLSSSPKLMQGLSGGLLGYTQSLQESKRQKALEEMRAMKMQEQQMALQQAQAAQARQQGIDQAYRGAMRSPQQLAMAANGGPTNAAAQAAPNMAPGIDQNALIQGLMQADPQSAYQMLQPKPADYKVVGNALLRVGPGGVKEAYRAPEKPDLPSAVREYEYAKNQGYGGSFQQFQLEQRRAGASSTSVSYGSPVAGVDAKGNPVFFQPSKDGGAPSIVQGVAPAKTDKPLTESQAKAAAFASQMLSAEQALGGAGTNGANLGDQVQTRIAQGAGNFVVSPEAQKARQAQEQWAEAFLRFKTGAAATEGEVLRNVRTYFPQPGDKAEVVAQKAEMRRQAAHDVKINAGNANIESVAQPKKQVVRTGTMNGRKVVQYADGTTAYAD